MSTLPQPQVNYFVEMDKNGVTWLFPRQEFQNSCGPACLRYVKSLFHDSRFTEDDARQQISQFELRRPVGGTEKGTAYNAALSQAKDPTSIKSVKQALKMVLAYPDGSKPHETRASGPWIGASSWQGMGTRPELVVEALKSDPMPVSSARLVNDDYRAHLSQTTDKYPAIIAVIWMLKYAGAAPTVEEKKNALASTQGTGGHFILCSGLTRDGSQYIILDPMNGLRYIPREDVSDTCILYDSGGSLGKADVAIQKNTKPTGVSDALVEYVARGRFSKCGVIVTYPQI